MPSRSIKVIIKKTKTIIIIIKVFFQTTTVAEKRTVHVYNCNDMNFMSACDSFMSSLLSREMTPWTQDDGSYSIEFHLFRQAPKWDFLKLIVLLFHVYISQALIERRKKIAPINEEAHILFRPFMIVIVRECDDFKGDGRWNQTAFPLLATTMKVMLDLSLLRYARINFIQECPLSVRTKHVLLKCPFRIICCEF